jgi:DNA polymerase III epsilon subunit family exonuclease
VQAARKLEMTFEQRSGCSELIYDVFSVQFPTSISVLTCYNPARMAPYPNLVSDSTLVQDTIDLLTGSGGRAPASEIVDAVFKLSHIDDELAGLLVADLVRNDRRFKIVENTVELLEDDSRSRLLKDLDFVVVDVEATGAKTPPNRLIELGAYRIRGGRIVDKFLSLVNPEIPIPRFVAALTGISNEMVKRAPVFADVAPQWLDFVSDSVLVAHNAPFDTSFLNHEISRVYPGHRMVNQHLCTVMLSRRALTGLLNHRLDTIANHFSIPILSRHRAGSDALATAEIFIRILTELEETHGIKDLAAARRFQFPELQPV